jgi:hypothetical protein
MYVLKQQELIPIELRMVFNAELAGAFRYSFNRPERMASAILLMTVVDKCNVSPFELCQLELDLGNSELVETMMLTSKNLGFDYVESRIESLPHQNFPNPRFEYLDTVRASYNATLIEFVKAARPHGVSSPHDLAGLQVDMYNAGALPLP